MKSEQGSSKAPAVDQEGTDRRRSARYPSAEALFIRHSQGSVTTGVSVEISKGGISAMVSGTLRVGDSAELFPVAGGIVLARVQYKLGQLYGFEFMEISEEQVRAIEENCRKLKTARPARRSHDGKQ